MVSLFSYTKETKTVSLIPVYGCDFCPSKKFRPKIEASGSMEPILYFLIDPTSKEDLVAHEFFRSSQAEVILNLLPDSLVKLSRFNAIAKCITGNKNSYPICKPYIVSDIEKTRPIVVVGIGDDTLSWATGLTSASKYRGRFIPVKFGAHVCWYYHIGWPEHNKYKSESPANLLLKKEIKDLLKFIENLPTPEFVSDNYDSDIEIFLGMPEELEHLYRKLELLAEQPVVAIDIETTGLKPYTENSKILSVALSSEDINIAFPLDFKNSWGAKNKDVWDKFNFFIRNSGIKVAHNLTFEQEWLSYFLGKDILFTTNWGDTLAIEHTIDERQGTLSLNNCIRKYFGFFLKDLSNLKITNLESENIKDVLKYNALDAKWTYKLYKKQELKAPALIREYQRKIRTIPALVLAQQAGVIVDFDYTEEIYRDLTTKVAEIKKNIVENEYVKQYEKVNGALNIDSPDQIVTLFLDIMGRKECLIEVDGVKKRSASEEVLSSMAEEVPMASDILQYRAYQKLLSTYIMPVINKEIVYPDGKMHTTFNLMLTTTGRLSSNDPNMQNFPKRKYQYVRGIVKAPDNHKIVSIDYAQIEARVIAMASKDENLVKYVWDDYDIHMTWAKKISQAYPKILKEIDDDYKLNGDEKVILKTFRSVIKNKWVFPQFFGSSVYSCARNLGIPKDVLIPLSDEFWEEFPGVKEFQKKLSSFYEKNLYVATLTGRRRRGMMSYNEIINTPIQGTASDIVVNSMVRLSRKAFEEGRDYLQPVINIHDDLTFYLPEKGLNDIVMEICEIMVDTKAFDFINVPLGVEVSVGDHWHNQKEILKITSKEFS
jgi:DNA polymerase-1